MWRKGNPRVLLVGMQTGAAIVESFLNIRSFLNKLKMKQPYDPVLPLLGIYPKKPETQIQKKMHTTMFPTVIYNSQDLETAQVSISR